MRFLSLLYRTRWQMRVGKTGVYYRKQPGIYRIQNTVTNMVYIGQSRDIPTRWARHMDNYRNKREPGYDLPLYEDIRSFGIDKFIFSILETCTIGRLDELEQK